ncbi:MAG: glycosyltransferase family 4 protein [Actinomycetota bacterium]|nr:glycosyltransferase family 4 protein [Actinomycetota bacterium]
MRTRETYSGPAMRVLIVGKGPPERGGIAAMVQTLRERLATDNDVELLNLTRDDIPRCGRLSPGNVWRTLEDTLSVWRVGRGWNIVDIHSALTPLVTIIRAGLLALVARGRGAHVVVHAHGGNLQSWLDSTSKRVATRLALSAAHGVVAVSQGVHDSLADVLGPGRVRLVENGVDVERFRGKGPPHDRPRVLYVGLLTPRKGVVDLLRASELLRSRGVSHELVIVGGTPDEGPEAEAEVRAVAGDGVVLRGVRPHEEMPAVYRDADVFCLPSWWEAMPLSVLEAMASGLPVVATRVGDIPRIVDDEVTGILVPARDHEALADALEVYLADSGRRRAAGQAGRERVEKGYSVDAMVRATVDAYRSVTESSLTTPSRQLNEPAAGR